MHTLHSNREGEGEVGGGGGELVSAPSSEGVGKGPLTLLVGLAKLIPRMSMPLIMAANDWIALLYTTGRYCLHSSLLKPDS